MSAYGVTVAAWLAIAGVSGALAFAGSAVGILHGASLPGVGVRVLERGRAWWLRTFTDPGGH